MGRFDTHGGYFAPQDYFRVDTGGSHDENSNGGVQVGVDEQGIPNLLEEGEPVYDDYVYSDNIVSDKEILVKHNLPARYAGMLYSKIADSFVDEAAERPNDPISNNGLNALLVRLADAQEEQKQIEAQRELEEELAQLSPEELAQVEQALAMQEQQAAAGEQMAAQQDIPQEAMTEQQMVPEEALAQEQIMQQQVPVMACGGTLLRRFDAGGPKKNALAEALEVANDIPVREVRSSTGIGAAGDTGYISQEQANAMAAAAAQARQMKQDNYDAFVDQVAHVPVVGEVLAPTRVEEIRDEEYAKKSAAWEAQAKPYIDSGQQIPDELLKATPIAPYKEGFNVLDFIGGSGFLKSGKAAKAAKATKTAKKAEKPMEVVNAERNIARRTKQLEEAEEALANGRKSGLSQTDIGYLETEVDILKTKLKHEEEQLASFNRSMSVPESVEPISSTGGSAANTEVPAGNTSIPETPEVSEAANKPKKKPKAKKIAKWVGGSAALTGIGVPTYLTYTGQGRPSFGEISRSYSSDGGGFPTFDADSVFMPVPVVPADTTAISDTTQANQRALGGPVNKFDGESFSQMFRFKPMPTFGTQLPDVTTPPHEGMVFDPVLGQWIQKSLNLESNIDKTGRLAAEATPGTWEWAQAIGRNNPFSTTGVNLDGVSSGANTGNGVVVDAGAGADVNTRAIPLPKPLSTSSRYVGPLTAAALGIYNALQKPTRFTMPHYVPTIPEGRMHLYNPSFNPLDVNLAVNSINASGAGTMYGLRNSGLGPSTAQAMIAVDNNIGKNIGNAQTQAWDANNQRRNAVLAAMNQNGSALGQFDYGVARNAASLLNDMRLRNAQNDLMLQRLNDASETQQYAAVQNQIDQVAQALSAIGRENLTFNQINSNTALPYNVWNNGAAYYAPTGIQPSNPYADLAYNAKTKEVYNTKTGAVVAKNVG